MYDLGLKFKKNKSTNIDLSYLKVVHGFKIGTPSSTQCLVCDPEIKSLVLCDSITCQP